MANERPLELCCCCDTPTDKAGASEDSLYTEDGEGPYCEPCYNDAHIEELEDEIVTLRNNFHRDLAVLRHDLDLRKTSDAMQLQSDTALVQELRTRLDGAHKKIRELMEDRDA